MADTCSHLDHIHEGKPSGTGCVECLQIGSTWVHLRRCAECGHVGCCDNSPNRHATAHANETTHPIIQSFEPGEEWFYCYPDDLVFEIEGAPSYSY